MKTWAIQRRGGASALTIALAVFALIMLWGLYRPETAEAKIVIAVPHCDDEAIFAGEVIWQYIKERRYVAVVFTTDCSGPPAFDLTHPNYGHDRFEFAKSQLQAMGYADIRTLGVDSSYNGRTLAQKTDDMAYRLRRTYLIQPGDEIWTISATGHIDHEASYAALTSIAQLKGISRMYIYWGYTSTGLIYSPPEGVPVTNFMTDDNKWAKNRQLNGYYNWFNSYYPEAQESLLTARRNSHDVISYISLPTE